MKLYNTILVSFMCLCLSSCFDLENENFSKISSENFPQSEADLEAAAIGVYHSLGKSFIQQFLDYAGWTLNELCTDELNTSWGSAWEQTDKFLWTANNTASSGVYTTYHQGITKATRIIDAFAKSDVNEKKKEKYIAELRALRTLYAKLLYSMYGPLPIVTDPEVANDVYKEWKPERPTDKEYVDFMTKELEESYSHLDVTPNSNDWGRMTQGAALTLLMKIYLNDKQWENAANTAQRIIDLHIYELLPVYKDVFSIENEGPGNKEVIFPIQRLTSDENYSWSYFACVMPSSPLYQPQNGVYMSIWGGLKMPWNFYDKYEENDSRLETIVRYYTDTDGNRIDYRTVNHPKATGAAPMKYSEDPEQKGAQQGNDFIMFRYADVILSRAEALNEISGPTQEVEDLINMIRRRANATEIKYSDFTKESLRDFLLDERGRELYCEGHRREDLIRHGKFIQKAREDGFNAEDYHVLYPIPQSAMNENSNLKQNPGYEN